jgi:hypothetical protein
MVPDMVWPPITRTTNFGDRRIQLYHPNGCFVVHQSSKQILLNSSPWFLLWVRVLVDHQSGLPIWIWVSYTYHHIGLCSTYQIDLDKNFPRFAIWENNFVFIKRATLFYFLVFVRTGII